MGDEGRAVGGRQGGAGIHRQPHTRQVRGPAAYVHPCSPAAHTHQSQPPHQASRSGTHYAAHDRAALGQEADVLGLHHQEGEDDEAWRGWIVQEGRGGEERPRQAHRRTVNRGPTIHMRAGRPHGIPHAPSAGPAHPSRL